MVVKRCSTLLNILIIASWSWEWEKKKKHKHFCTFFLPFLPYSFCLSSIALSITQKKLFILYLDSFFSGIIHLSFILRIIVKKELQGNSQRCDLTKKKIVERCDLFLSNKSCKKNDNAILRKVISRKKNNWGVEAIN